MFRELYIYTKRPIYLYKETCKLYKGPRRHARALMQTHMHTLAQTRLESYTHITCKLLTNTNTATEAQKLMHARTRARARADAFAHTRTRAHASGRLQLGQVFLFRGQDFLFFQTQTQNKRRQTLAATEGGIPGKKVEVP